jgi:ApaG protein
LSETVTEGIRIEVETRYVPERSSPGDSEFLFSYRITISNLGEAPAKLMSRHWIITDGLGEVEHVKGPGVVGEQPRLEPGQGFQYRSYCPLPTPIGSMMGTFQMVRDDGSTFDAEIASYSLSAPSALN